MGKRGALAAVLVLLLARTGMAIPQYARKHNLRCNVCHILPPKLNAFGLAYWQRGYRLPDQMASRPERDTAPLAAWITTRQEERPDRGFSELFVPRVELISGGAIGDTNLSYFLEWRLGSLETRSDGTLLDRSGRFEDAFLNWYPTDSWQFTVGQFRPLNQVDVSRRLSVSEPIVFSTSVPGEPSSDSRVTALRAFSPSGRSPGLMLMYQSVKGETAEDGLFHSAVLPFVGEWTLPVTPEARRNARFVSQGPPKGAFLETFYRYDLSSLGGHIFIGDDRWIVNSVATVNLGGVRCLRDVHVTAGLGWDDSLRTPSRSRSSFEIEYLPIWSRSDFLRPGAGFRVERVTGPGTSPAYVPFFALSGPNEEYSFLLQVEYRFQPGNDAFFLDLSVLF
jgi:hypothetical protein